MEGKYKDISQIHITRGKRSADTPLQRDHFHRYYELFYLVSGKCRFLLKDSIYNLEKGNFVFISPGELHHSLYFPGTVCDVSFLYFKEDFFMTTVPGFHLPPLRQKSFMGTVPSLFHVDFQTLLNRLLSEQGQIDEHSPSFMLCYLNELLLFLMRHSVLSEEDPELINAKEADILIATKYIYQNFQKPLTLENVAAVSALSPTYFSKKFKATTGMGFKQYLNFIRLKHSAAALLTTNRSITDIALEYGFNDSNYFKDLFKKEYGCSPREFRKRQQD